MAQILEAATAAKEKFVRLGLCAEPDTIYVTKSDFERADPDLKRLVVVGESGAGKSTFLNIIAGWNFECHPDPKPDDEDNTKNVWQPKGDKEKIFETRFSSKGVQKEAQLAHLKWFNNAKRPVIAVDTVGVLDPEQRDISNEEVQDDVKRVLVDIHDKLEALKKVHVVLVIHNDVVSCRLKQAISQVLDMLNTKFPEEEHVWKHIAIICTKCNSVDRGWRDQLEKRKNEIREGIYKDFPQSKKQLGKDVLPVFAVGGLTKPCKSAEEEPGFKELWEFIEKTGPISTENLQPWAGDHQKYKDQVDKANHEKDMRKAAELWSWVMIQVALLFTFFLLRAHWLPSFLGFMLLNLPGFFDELILLAVFICHYIGRNDFMNVMRYVYEEKLKEQPFFKEKVEPLIGQYIEPLLQKSKAD